MAEVKAPCSKVMIWSEEEAALKQIEQVGTSACGATAALNVLVKNILENFVKNLIMIINRIRGMIFSISECSWHDSRCYQRYPSCPYTSKRS